MSSTDAASHNAYLGRKYFPELDGLRALSVLLVITRHLYDTERWSWLAGARGVTIFFVLSGYLITTLALREEAARGRLSLAAFYVRRCCRILPLYYLTLAAYCLLIYGAGFLPDQAQALRAALPYDLLYLQEAPYYLWHVLGKLEVPLSHGWTLGIEEKFYLLWPLIAFVFWRGAGRRRLGGAAALALAFAAAPALLTPLGREAHVLGGMALGYFSLLSGCVLAFLLHDPLWFARLRRLGAARPAAALAALLAAHLATPWVRGPVWEDLLGVAYTAAVTAFLAGVLVGGGPIRRALGWPPLAAVGRLSYGIYLIHIICMCAAYKLVPPSGLGWPGNLLVLGLTCLFSVAAAWCLHAAVESPCIELGRHWSRRIVEAAAPAGVTGRRRPAVSATASPGG